MNTCKNCVYWETHQYWGEKPFHACDKVDRGPDFAMKIEVSDDTGLTAHLVTGPEFGCIHFEAGGGAMTQPAKHTPGPWHLGMKPGPMVYGPQGEQVVPLNLMLDMPEVTANAHLIAAAPAMYADGKVLCGLVRDFMNDNRLYDGQVIQAIHNLETALAQAEARS